MIYSTLNLLFLMSAILLMCGLHYRYHGTAGGEQVRPAGLWGRQCRVPNRPPGRACGSL